MSETQPLLPVTVLSGFLGAGKTWHVVAGDDGAAFAASHLRTDRCCGMAAIAHPSETAGRVTPAGRQEISAGWRPALPSSMRALVTHRPRIGGHGGDIGVRELSAPLRRHHALVFLRVWHAVSDRLRERRQAPVTP
jgi:hypothetical protein